MQFAIKIIISALVIAGVSELAKRFAPIAAILASLPLTSILAMTWLYYDTRDSQKIIDLSFGIFWAVLPSLLFFLVLPLFLKADIKFSLAMIFASVVMTFGYILYLFILSRFGIHIQ